MINLSQMLEEKKEQYRKEGFELEKQEKYEEAYRKYEAAAKLRDIPSMLCIAALYLSGHLRPVARSNVRELILQGTPIFPWDQNCEVCPDYKNALAWLIKAADLGDNSACEAVGIMICQGLGCEADVDKGIFYLKRALSNGQTSARRYICLYRPNGKSLSNEEYEEQLTEFTKAADSGDEKAYELYATLKSGTCKQLARLGHILISAQNVRRPGYELFEPAISPTGFPLLPVASKRGPWSTFVRFDLAAWAEKKPLIAISSSPELLSDFHRVRIVGTATYRSPAFGWLEEEKKHALLLQLGTDDTLDADAMKEVAESFHLREEEYQRDSIAFLVENGEKEYSFEVAGIQGDQVEILWRYTIGGTDRVEKYFEPELISMNYTER